MVQIIISICTVTLPYALVHIVMIMVMLCCSDKCFIIVPFFTAHSTCDLGVLFAFISGSNRKLNDIYIQMKQNIKDHSTDHMHHIPCRQAVHDV